MILMFDNETDSTQMKKQLGLFRFSLIAPVVNNCHAFRSNEAYFRDAATKEYFLPNGKKVIFAAGTIKSWYVHYMIEGFNALLPKLRDDLGVSRSIDESKREEILALKKQFPYITGKLLYQKLVENGVINAKDVSNSSFYRFLKANEVRITHLNTHERKAYEMEFANDCWQVDTSHGLVISIDGKKFQTYLIMIIDDASRQIVGQQFFLNDNALNVQFVLKQAVTTYGIPKKVFVDNGTPYKNLQFQLICANLGTILIHSKPYSPESKGKIERSFRTVKDNWINGVDWNEYKSLEKLNEDFAIYINESYNNSVHTAIGMTPRLRFKQDYSRLKFLNKDEINKIFLHSIKRTVYTDATIKLHAKLFEVPQKYIRQEINIRYSPDDLDLAYIFDQHGNLVETICPVKKIDNSKVKRTIIDYSRIGGDNNV